MSLVSLSFVSHLYHFSRILIISVASLSFLSHPYHFSRMLIISLVSLSFLSYPGDVGNASKMKSVMNLLDGVMMAGLAEAMALTEQVWVNIGCALTLS